MSEVKRYEMISVTRCGEGWQELQRDPEGDWVQYDDYAALERVAEQMLEALLGIASSTSSCAWGYYGDYLSKKITLGESEIKRIAAALECADKLLGKETT